MNAEISANLPNNSAGSITPAIVRTTLTDMVNSWQQYTGVNAQVGTTYAVVVGDYGQLLTFTNGSPVAVSLPQATGSFTPFNAYFTNLGVGTVTITPTTSTIDGAASFPIITGQSVWVVSDGTNYQVFKGYGSGVVNSGTANQLAYYATTGTAVSGLTNGSTGTVLRAGTPPAWSTATYPATATGTGTILRADGTNWSATTATYPNTTTINQVLYSSSANVIAGLATANGGILNTGATGIPAITPTPVLGLAGTTVGTLGFQNATTGTITLSPVAGALGTVTLTLPAATDTVAVLAASQAFTNKTYNGNTWTAGTGTLTIAASKTLTASNTLTLAGTDSTTMTFPSVSATISRTVASGAKALATGAISSAACTSAQTDTATGTATTDAIAASFNADPTGVTGYVPLTAGMLTIIAYPTADTVNFKVCNNTASSITPGAVTINWRVVR